MPRTPLHPLAALSAAVLTACAPWRSDIELTPGIAAAPVLEVRGWQPPIQPTGPRRIVFGPWTAERIVDRDADWLMTVRQDSVVIGSAACRSEIDGNLRRKGSRRDVPQEVFSCEMSPAASPDTVRLAVKADAGHSLTGDAESGDWHIVLRGTDRLRTRSCFVVTTCGWYLSLDGMDIAAVEADARAWVYISPDLGTEVRGIAALITGALLLRVDPEPRYPGSAQRPMAPY